MDKFWLQTSLQPLVTTPTKTINIITYFENLIVVLYVFYIFKTHVKFHVNWMLFTIQLINLFFMHNFILQKLEI